MFHPAFSRSRNLRGSPATRPDATERDEDPTPAPAVLSLPRAAIARIADRSLREESAAERGLVRRLRSGQELRRRLLPLHQEAHAEFARERSPQGAHRQPAAKPGKSAVPVRDVE